MKKIENPTESLKKVADAMYFTGAEQRALFRLGQMDMQASACAMLRKMADAAAPSLSTGLNIAADLVEELEVMNADA